MIEVFSNELLNNAANGNTNGVNNLLNSIIIKLVIFIGAFGGGLAISCFLWPILLCCCTCPGACPHKKCQRDEDEGYSKCELTWPIFMIFAVLLMTFSASIYGTPFDIQVTQQWEHLEPPSATLDVQPSSFSMTSSMAMLQWTEQLSSRDWSH